MNGYLYKLFTGQLNPSETIRSDSADYKGILQQFVEIQKKLSITLTQEQCLLLDEMQTQKNLAVAYEMYEAFRTGVSLAVGILEDLARY